MHHPHHHPWGPPGPGKDHHHLWGLPGPGKHHHHPWGPNGPGKHRHPWGPPPMDLHDESDKHHDGSSRAGGEPAGPHNGLIISMFGLKTHHLMHSFSGSSSSNVPASSSAESKSFSEDSTLLSADSKSSSDDATSLSADLKSSSNIASSSKDSKSSSSSSSSSADTVPFSRKASELPLWEEGLSEDPESDGEMLPRRSLNSLFC
ncbi:hypothetical protein MHU86_4480 [Fragilaria crotonensis]|nr:hypothetical protein MHU86_4480 [Fragilaria crotonensis]